MNIEERHLMERKQNNKNTELKYLRIAECKGGYQLFSSVKNK